MTGEKKGILERGLSFLESEEGKVGMEKVKEMAASEKGKKLGAKLMNISKKPKK